MTTIEKLIRQVFVKENLRRARSPEGCPGNAMSTRETAKALGVSPMQILRWEDPNGGVPEGKNLLRAVRWVRKRLRIRP